MKISALALVAVMGMLGVALGMGYGYSGYSYVPYYGGATQGAGDGSILMLIGLLFILLLLFSNNSIFNSTSSTTPISIIQG